MFNFFYKFPDLFIFVVLNGIAILFSIIAVTLIEKWIPSENRYKENQGIGYVSSTICLIFAVLAGFAALFVLNNFNKASEVVQEEANYTMAIYDLAKWLEEPYRSRMQNDVKKYLEEVIQIDWPAMKGDENIGNETDRRIDQLAEILKESYQQKNGSFPQKEILNKIISLKNSRTQRVNLRHSALDPDIWFVILISGILTLSINFAFGMQFHLHLATVTGVAITVFSMVFLLIVLDRPFDGSFSVTPHLYEKNIELMNLKHINKV